jgi:hypothetical protein
VVQAKQSHFMGMLFGGIALVLIGLAAAGFLVLNPDFVVGYRGVVDASGLYMFWRLVDFALCGAIAAGGGVMIRGAVNGMVTLDHQLLVLLPEGFVMQKGSSSKTMAAVAYASVNTPRVIVRNGTVYLVASRTDGRGAVNMELDGRFGPPKQIAKRIIEAHSMYARVAARGEQQ